jgi:mRNA interferase RelE/StbE
MYQIIIPSNAKKLLKKLDKNIQGRIVSALEKIQVNPFRFIEKLTDTQYYKLRVGDYRVILDIFKDKLIILVIKLGHRKKIYK